MTRRIGATEQKLFKLGLGGQVTANKQAGSQVKAVIKDREQKLWRLEVNRFATFSSNEKDICKEFWVNVVKLKVQ